MENLAQHHPREGAEDAGVTRLPSHLSLLSLPQSLNVQDSAHVPLSVCSLSVLTFRLDLSILFIHTRISSLLFGPL
jgi:hypothetical protein